MSKVQKLRLLVCRSKVSKLTTCRFHISNCMEKNIRHKTVFERYLDFQSENKVSVNDEVTTEVKEVNIKLNSSPSVSETEQCDRMDDVGHSESWKIDSGRLLTNETVSDELKSKTQNIVDQDQVQKPISNDRISSNLIKPNQNANEDENSKILKSNVQIKTPVSSSPLDFILNCEMMPDVNSTMKCEEYLLFHEHLEKSQIKMIPSVSHIINKTDPKKQFLIKWKKSKIEQLGEEGFNNYMKDIQDVGQGLHSTIYRYLGGEKKIKITEDIQGYWNSIEHVIESFKETDIKMLEGKVENPILHYHGGFDCIAVYRNTLCIIEWKSSRKSKPFLSTTGNNPIQAVAYLGAINASFDLDFKKLGPVTNAVIVVAYPFGQPAHVHYMSDKMVNIYWNQWLQLLHTYWSSKS